MKAYNQTKNESSEDFAPQRPVIRTFYDHAQPISDIDFHPGSPVLVSCSRDCTIKFYDYKKLAAKRAFRYLQDTHNVRSVAIHPCGDFVLAGTDHPMVRLYDVNTFQCYTGAMLQDHHTAPVNQARYTPDGTIFASCSKDGSVKLWDAINSKCINTIPNAHSGMEVNCIQFSRNQKYLLSAGKDSTVRIWELTTGRQLMYIVTGHHQQKTRMQSCFSFNEDFVITPDEHAPYAVVVWDTRSGELVQRLTGHNNSVRWLCSSPTEQAFVSCSMDHRARFWVSDTESTFT